MLARRLGWISALLVICFSATAAGAADRCKLVMTPPIPVKVLDLRPVIVANINGADAQFIVDTGSFYDFISPAAATQFKLQVGNAPFGYYVTGAGGSEIPQLATAHTFTVAGFSVHGATFLVGNNDFQDGNVGVLGQNLFRVADVDFDFADGALRFARPQHCADQVLAYWAGAQPIGAVDLHWTSRQQTSLLGKISMNGRDIEALFDTGSPRTILSLRAAKRAGITPDSPGVVAAGSSGGGIGRDAFKVWVAPIDKLEIGGETIQHTHLLIGDINLGPFGADMLIGLDFFLAHHIYVAYSQNRMYFTYNGGRVFDLNQARPEQKASASKTPAPAAAAAQQVAATASDAPTDAAGYMRRGIAFISRHEYPEAIADLTRACDLDPADADCRYQRGLAYWYSAQRESALADFNAAIQLQPNDFEAHLARAQFELKQRPADAQTDLAAVDRLAPQEADLRLTLAGLYRSTASYAAAVHQYDLWIEYHPDDFRLYAALGNRCGTKAAANMDLGRALKDCNKALRAIPRNMPATTPAVILNSRGMVYLRQGRLGQAFADFDAALKLLPKSAFTRFGRGLVELRRGMTDQGRADLAAAEAQEPGLAKQFASMGLTP